MSHVGADLDKHLEALREHGDNHRAELRDAAREHAVELEAQRAAAGEGEPDGHDEPAASA